VVWVAGSSLLIRPLPMVPIIAPVWP